MQNSDNTGYRGPDSNHGTHPDSGRSRWDWLGGLLSQLHIAFALFDSNERCLASNGALQVEIGCAPTTIGELAKALADGSVATDVLTRDLTGALRNQGQISTKIDLDGTNGVGKVLELSAQSFVDESAPVLAVMLRDSSTEERLYREIEELERQAAAGQLAAGVAHEFNNILTATLGWTQIARRASTEPSTRDSALEMLENNMQRAKQISTQLLDVTRPGEQVEQLFHLAEAAEDALRLLAWELDEAGVEVLRDNQPTDPCRGSSTRLVQVFVNIIRNAIEAMAGPGQLKIRTRQKGPRVVAEITDSGPGIAPAVVERIFEPCFTTKERGDAGSTGGSGLGLSISARIIHQHGGTITAAPAPQSGTIFTITLPVADDQPFVTAEPVNGRSTFPPGVSVLVVDDEPDICEMIRTALSLRGAYVVVAGNGQEAVDLCRRERFDAAFVDFLMTGLSGHDLGRALVKVQPELPLVFMSGRRVEVDPHPHVADFLKKPFDLHEIQQKLREVLDRALAD